MEDDEDFYDESNNDLWFAMFFIIILLIFGGIIGYCGYTSIKTTEDIQCKCSCCKNIDNYTEK